MDEVYETRWQELWTDACEAFKNEAGDAPPEELEPWEGCLLQRLLFTRLEKPLAKRLRRQHSQLAKQTLDGLQRCLQQMVTMSWKQTDAELALEKAHQHECSGEWEKARENYAEALWLGPAQPLQCSLRFAQLLHIMATSGSGDEGASEQVLRRAISQGSDVPGKRALQARLIRLLLQQGRNEEAKPLLVDGGWKYHLAPWILCPDVFPDGLEEKPASPQAGFPGCVFDDAIPEGFLQHLQSLLSPTSEFWTEHVYNEILGSSKVGYFSYVQNVEGEVQNTIDLIIHHIWELLKETHLFPSLEEASVAEWWAHKRPHGCGHQMHYDSDNEGIGGVRNPICSCIIYVNAPLGVGGPTLVTDQKLCNTHLGTKGWLVTPKRGRLAAYDGTHFHSVVPGCGKAPSVSEHTLGLEGPRRITFMIAFWKEIQTRPFGPDGLPGSSRPLPNPAQVFEIGKKKYTWHRRLALPLEAGTSASPIAVSPPCRTPVWTEVNGGDVGDGVALPAIEECFQF